MNQNYNYNMNYKLPNNPPFNNQYIPNNNDRLIGGGFLGPFLLGGVGGYLLGRPNYNGPIPVYFPNGVPYNSYPISYYKTNFYY